MLISITYIVTVFLQRTKFVYRDLFESSTPGHLLISLRQQRIWYISGPQLCMFHVRLRELVGPCSISGHDTVLVLE